MLEFCKHLSEKIAHFYRQIFIKKVRVLFIGLESQGKSHLIPVLFGEEYKELPPTPRIKVDKYQKDNYEFTIYDIPGRHEFRAKWDQYYKRSDFIVFVMDANASEAVTTECREELSSLVYRNAWVIKAILVVLTKNDAGGMQCKDAIIALDLGSMLDREVAIYSCSAMRGTNIKLVYEWFLEQIETMEKGL